MPVELVLGIYKLLKENPEIGTDLLMQNIDTVNKLLNITLSKDPEKATRMFREKVRSMQRDFSVRCVGEYCVYQYKEISAKAYLRAPLLSVMRGYVVKWEGSTGRMMAFPFAKFFNYMETKYTKTIPSTGFTATEKLDGTLIVVWLDPDTGEIHYNTRGLLEWNTVIKGKARCYIGVTEGIGNPFVKAFLNAVDRLGLKYELETLVREDRTVMFELVGKIPASQAHYIGVEPSPDDPSWTPHLLGYRDHRTMEIVYVSSTAFPIPKRITVSNVEELYEVVKNWKDKEGVVLHYPGMLYRPELGFKWWNYLVKLKSPYYLLRSELMVGDIILWRNVARAVILGAHDDITSIAEAMKSTELKNYADEVWRRYLILRDLWMEVHNRVPRTGNRLDESFKNLLKYGKKMGWLVPYLEDRRVEGSLRRLLIESMPRKKEAILKFLDRINSRLQELLGVLRGSRYGELGRQASTA